MDLIVVPSRSLSKVVCLPFGDHLGCSERVAPELPVSCLMSVAFLYSPQRGVTLSCQVARVPEPVCRILRHVYPSPFGSMDG